MRVEQTDEFQRGLEGLRDRAGRARVLVRVDRLIHGNPGVHRHLSEGVSELRIEPSPLNQPIWFILDERSTGRPVGLKTMKNDEAVDWLSPVHTPLPRPPTELSIMPLDDSEPSLNT